VCPKKRKAPKSLVKKKENEDGKNKSRSFLEEGREK